MAAAEPALDPALEPAPVLGILDVLPPEVLTMVAKAAMWNQCTSSLRVMPATELAGQNVYLTCKAFYDAIADVPDFTVFDSRTLECTDLMLAREDAKKAGAYPDTQDEQDAWELSRTNEHRLYDFIGSGSNTYEQSANSVRNMSYVHVLLSHRRRCEGAGGAQLQNGIRLEPTLVLGLCAPTKELRFTLKPTMESFLKCLFNPTGHDRATRLALRDLRNKDKGGYEPGIATYADTFACGEGADVHAATVRSYMSSRPAARPLIQIVRRVNGRDKTEDLSHLIPDKLLHANVGVMCSLDQETYARPNGQLTRAFFIPDIELSVSNLMDIQLTNSLPFRQFIFDEMPLEVAEEFAPMHTHFRKRLGLDWRVGVWIRGLAGYDVDDLDFLKRQAASPKSGGKRRLPRGWALEPEESDSDDSDDSDYDPSKGKRRPRKAAVKAYQKLRKHVRDDAASSDQGDPEEDMLEYNPGGHQPPDGLVSDDGSEELDSDDEADEPDEELCAAPEADESGDESGDEYPKLPRVTRRRAVVESDPSASEPDSSDSSDSSESSDEEPDGPPTVSRRPPAAHSPRPDPASGSYLASKRLRDRSGAGRSGCRTADCERPMRGLPRQSPALASGFCTVTCRLRNFKAMGMEVPLKDSEERFCIATPAQLAAYNAEHGPAPRGRGGARPRAAARSGGAGSSTDPPPAAHSAPPADESGDESAPESDYRLISEDSDDSDEGPPPNHSDYTDSGDEECGVCDSEGERAEPPAKRVRRPVG
jgi:hypothetical protein